MTCYNREKYIAEAIESVLNSSYKDWELIICDDRSADSSVAIIKRYADRDSRIKYYVNDTNLGDYPNRNRAAGYASGKYLKYLDADDLIYPWGLELLISMMEKFPGAGWGLCSLEQDDKYIFPFELSPEQAYIYAYFGPGLFHKAPLSSIIKKQIFDETGGFSGKQHLGDFEMWHLFACKFPVVLMPHGIVWHRIHDQQQSSDNRINPFVSFKYTVSALHYFQTSSSIPLSSDKRQKVMAVLQKRAWKIIMVKLLKCQFSTAYKMYSMLNDYSYNLGK